jgi:hypothetical protein
VYRRLLNMALEELRLLDEQIGELDKEMAGLLSEHQTADHCRSRPYRSDLSLREMSLVVGACLPGRRRERRRKLQPPLSEGQPSHAAASQSSCERLVRFERGVEKIAGRSKEE